MERRTDARFGMDDGPGPIYEADMNQDLRDIIARHDIERAATYYEQPKARPVISQDYDRDDRPTLKERKEST